MAAASLRIPSSRSLTAPRLRPSQPAARAVAGRRKVRTVANAGFAALLESVPPAALVGGALLVSAAAVAAALSAKNAKSEAPLSPSAPAEATVSDAVLVFGAGGRLGREVVAALLASGRTVVAAARDAAKTRATLEASLAAASLSPASLVVRGGVDVSDAATLTSGLFAGVTQVVVATGAVFGKGADGQMGYIDGMTSERVDFTGNALVAEAAARHLSPAAVPPPLLLLQFGEEAELARFRRMDDVIMGGQSSSGWALVPAADGSPAHGRWSGQVVLEGGGFCGCRADGISFDLSAYDGLALRLRSDGLRYKLNVKTARNEGRSESTYQAVLDAASAGIAPGEWGTLRVAWSEFVPVLRQYEEEGAPPLEPASVRSLGLVLSRFEFNGLPNFSAPVLAGCAFALDLASVSAYAAPRPQLLLISSAGVERNARIGDDAAKRALDIPIVQLNPGGVLNHKYKGEAALRQAALAAGLRYAVLRPTGLDAGAESASALQLGQGDAIAGRVSRAEVARVAQLALRCAAAADATWELKRSEAAFDAGKSSSDAELLSALQRLVPDGARTRVGLRPLPAPRDPPPPATPVQREAILSRSDVQASLAAGRGGRTRGVETQDSGATALPSNVVDAAQWISNWRAKQAAEARAST